MMDTWSFSVAFFAASCKSIVFLNNFFQVKGDKNVLKEKK